MGKLNAFFVEQCNDSHQGDDSLKPQVALVTRPVRNEKERVF